MGRGPNKPSPKKPTADIVIALNAEGGVNAIKIPDGMTVEVRDYNVPEDWEKNVDEDGGAGDENGEVVTDDEGDRYQSIILKG